MSTTPKDDTITLLYVEDHPASREVLRTTLELQLPDVRVVCAGNGREGLEIFRCEAPQIVLTDINMPEMSGIDMAAEIKRLAPQTIIIAVTAHSETQCLLKAIETGVNHFALKPIDHDTLFAVLDRSLAQVRRERELQRQAQHISKLSQALEQSPSSVVITDRTGRIEYVNTKFSELTGYSLEEAQGRNVQFLKSGLVDQQVYEDLWRTISGGREWRGEFINLKKNGEPYWETASIAPLIDAGGEITHYIAVKEDITAAKRAREEITRLNDSLAQRAAELESANRDLEAFNYTVSHDLRSPLSIIHGFAQLLHDRCPPGLPDECRSHAAIILQEARKMDGLIRALLRFSRLSSQDIRREPVNLSQLALEASLDLRMRDPHRPARFDIAEGVCCTGDPDLLRIVLENLLGNAWKYSAPRPETQIEFGCRAGDGNVCFFVRDNGVGFAPEKAGQLFTRFTRLHNDEQFEGFGIGLATVERIIEKHGGRVWAEGELDQGATFSFMLPVGQDDAADSVGVSSPGG